jgi:polar amino acid transport system substrate-binding protein
VRRIRERDRLVVGVDQNSFLWGYRNPATGRLEGFDIDLVEAVAEDLLGPDPNIVYKTIPTDQRVVAVQDGEVDMVVRTMTINCDRAEQVAFSTAYFLSGQQLVVPKEGSAVTGLDRSVRGRRICLARGSTAEKLLQGEEFAALGARPVKVANQLDCLVRLQLGEADAVLTDNALGAGQAAQDPSVELVGRPATVEPYGIAMNLDDTDLVRRVNRVLEDYRKGGDDSAWRVSYDRWLAEMMDPGADGEPAPPAPAYDG